MTKRFCKDCTNRKSKFCSAKSEFVPRKAGADNKIIAADCKDYHAK